MPVSPSWTAADHWSETIGALFADASYHDHAAPLDRVLGYLEFRKALLQGCVQELTCVVGTIMWETGPGASCRFRGAPFVV